MTDEGMPKPPKYALHCISNAFLSLKVMAGESMGILLSCTPFTTSE